MATYRCTDRHQITSDQPSSVFLGGGVTIEGGEAEDAAVDPSSLGSYVVKNLGLGLGFILI